MPDHLGSDQRKVKPDEEGEEKITGNYNLSVVFSSILLIFYYSTR